VQRGAEVVELRVGAGDVGYRRYLTDRKLPMNAVTSASVAVMAAGPRTYQHCPITREDCPDRAEAAKIQQGETDEF
jgi:hypothetical protein